MLQIGHLLDRKPSQLSGGQRQRVAMGRALVRDPQVFLFDEPLSNLDAKLRIDMRTEIKRLHQRMKTTIVYVTHDQIEAMTLATKIAVLKDGILQQFGTPAEIYNNPVNMFVADFMGSPAMNLVPATIGANGNALISELRARRPSAGVAGAHQPARRPLRLPGQEGGVRRPPRGADRPRRRRPQRVEHRHHRPAHRGRRAGRFRHLSPSPISAARRWSRACAPTPTCSPAR